MNLHFERQLAAIKYGMVWRKPAFLGRMLGFYLKSFAVRGRQPLRYVDFAVDYDCNLKCAHCFKTTLETNQSRPRLTVEDYRRIARECQDLGAIHLSLQGGEVTLLKNLESLVRSMSPHRSLFSLTTNGTMITPQLARNLRSWGVDQLNISIDSFVPEEHDHFRGVKGSWQRTFDGLQTARKTGLGVQINTTVSKFNLYTPGFLQLVDYAIRERIILNIVLAAPSGNWDGKFNATLDDADMRCVRALIQSTPYVRQDMDSIVLGRGCPAIKEAIYITPFGDVLSCPFIHVSFGNLHDEPLKAIIDRALNYPFLREHAQRCLVAEERVFMEKYMSKVFGKPSLPISSEEVFGKPEEMAKEYPLPKPIVVADADVQPVLAEWRRRCNSGESASMVAAMDADAKKPEAVVGH